MKVQIVSKFVTQKYKEPDTGIITDIVEKRINNVEYIEFDILNDKFSITSDKKLRILFLDRNKYRLSLKSFKECRQKGLVGV